MAEFRILVINPGAGSTKVALFVDETKAMEESLRHSPVELSAFETTLDQLEFRLGVVESFLRRNDVDRASLSAVVGRGGAFKPLEGGTYRVNDAVLGDVREGNVQASHVSNLGCILARRLAEPFGIPAYFVDPVSVDEFEEISRLSGLPELPRVSLLHTLNTRYVAKVAARSIGEEYERINLIVAHLGTGISISAHRKGRIIDVNNANDGGPFSPQRVGTLPTTGLIELCYSGAHDLKSMLKRATKNGGLLAYLGTDDVPAIYRRIEEGEEKAKLVFDALVYQIAKEIGAAAAALKGDVRLIVVTGGMAKDDHVTSALLPYIEWIADTVVVPGENEMEALAFGALRVLRGEERAKEYA
jgi:butyrate kinase